MEYIIVLAGQPEQPSKRKIEIFATYQTQTSGPLLELAAAAKEKKVPNKSTVERIKTATDETFSILHSEKLMTTRLDAYESHWTSIKKIEDGLVFGVKATPFVKAFTVAGQDGANKVSTCTILVSASKGDGAVIRYIKSAELKGGKFKELGVTVVIQEVERAEYVFKSYRNDVETGSTQGVPYVDAKKTVKISIQEK